MLNVGVDVDQLHPLRPDENKSFARSYLSKCITININHMELGRLFGIIFGLVLSVPCYLYLLFRLISGRKVVSIKSRPIPPKVLQVDDMQ